jgi:hypothetical protein
MIGAVIEEPPTGGVARYVEDRAAPKRQAHSAKLTRPAAAPLPPLKPCTFVHTPSARACERRESTPKAERPLSYCTLCICNAVDIRTTIILY